MLHQYTQNDVNREPTILKKWLTNKTNENVKEKETSNKESRNKSDKSKK